jgi:uncharacterized membrane protein
MTSQHSSKSRAKGTDFRLRGTEVTRVEAFSDVVFGFALTLLVVSLEVPHTFNQLLADMSGFVPFAISFSILAQVWWVHHNFFRRYGLQDVQTIVLNFILLFVVLFYVYPIKFLFTLIFEEATGHSGVLLPNGQMEPFIAPNQGPLLMIIYGLGYTTVFLIFTLLYVHALRMKKELELNRIEAYDTQTNILENGLMAFIGVLCAVVAAVLPARKAGLAGFVFFLIAVGRSIIGARRGKGRRKLLASLAEPTSPEAPGS